MRSIVLLSSLTIFFSVFLISEVSVLIRLTNEDGVVENLSAICYASGFFFCCFHLFRNSNKYGFLAWAILCFMFLGEETSWFQRILDYSVPEIEAINSQGEMNLHNLEIFHATSIFEGEANIGLLIKSQNLFRMGFFTYFILFPIISRSSKVYEKLTIFGYRRPDFLFSVIVSVTLIFTFFLSLSADDVIDGAVAEFREFLYSFFILFYLTNYMRNAK